MTLIRWNPGMKVARWSPVTDLAAEFLNFRNDFERAFDRYWGDVNETPRTADFLRPKAEVTEHENGYTITVELPGIPKENLKITVSEGVLTVRGEKRQEAEVKGENTRAVERFNGSFERSFSLPTTVSAEKIAASYANGLLTINIPRAEHAKQREIEVAVG